MNRRKKSPSIEPEETAASESEDGVLDEQLNTPAERAAPDTDAEESLFPELEAEEEADNQRAWYVIHCYSGYENKVRHNLEQRIETMGMKDMIFDVVIPTQEEIEVKDGKRRVVERHVFPGYMLVN